MQETAPQLCNEENTSESEDDGQINKAQINCSTIKIRFNPMDFDYFTSVVRSEDESGLKSVQDSSSSLNQYIAPSQSVPEDFLNNRIKDVMKYEISSYEFKTLVLELLLHLVQNETVCKKFVDWKQAICLQSLNFSLETLCYLQFGSDTSYNLSPQLKCMFSRLLLCSLNKVLNSAETTEIAVHKGVLPLMLRLAEDVLRKITVEVVKNFSDPDECWMMNEYIFNVVYGVVTAVNGILSQSNSLEKLEQFLTLFNQFSNSLNGRLIDKTVRTILSFSKVNVKKSSDRAKKIISLVNLLIIALKKMRTKIVHARHCKRSKHRQCLLKVSSHHHDNIFGRAYTATILTSSNETNCSVSSLFMSLTKLLDIEGDKVIIVQTLQLMISCGMCCCFPPSILLKKISSLIKNGDQRVTNYSLLFLERTFYQQLGAFEENSNCKLCCRDFQRECSDETSEFSLNTLCVSESLPTDSRQSKWNCLYLFRDLLLAPDHKMAVLIGSHLLKILSHCKPFMKQEMLFTVFYPVFNHALEQYKETHLGFDKFLILTCLSVFTNLLKRVKLVEQFIEQKAMAHLRVLLKDKDAMNLCCSVIEIIIITKVWKAEQSRYTSGGLKMDIVFFSLKHVNEFEFFLNEILIVSAKCISFTNNAETEETNNPQAPSGYTSCSRNSLVFKSQDSYLDFCQTIVSLTYLWKTLANLSLCSPLVRQSIQERTFTVLTYTLMTTLLRTTTMAFVIRGKHNLYYRNIF